jgi:hypothetical protein
MLLMDCTRYNIVMPLIDAAMKSKFQDRIYNNLKKEFSPSASKGTNYQPVADEFWLKLSRAIADIAIDLVNEIHQNAMVAPGQAVVTAGSPAAHSGTTVSPGKIL